MFIKKTFKKKCPRVFNKKSTFICWNSLKTEKLLATGKELVRKNSVCCLKNQEIFFTERMNVQIGLTPLPLFIFVCFLKTTPPPPHWTYFLNDPPIIMSNANNLEVCPFIRFILEQHHHLAFAAIVRLIHCCLSFAAELGWVYDVIHFHEKKGFEFLIVPRFNKLYTRVRINFSKLYREQLFDNK